MENIFKIIFDEIIYLEYIYIYRDKLQFQVKYFSANGMEDFLNKALPKKNKNDILFLKLKIKDELLFIICEIIIISRNIEI